MMVGSQGGRYVWFDTNENKAVRDGFNHLVKEILTIRVTQETMYINQTDEAQEPEVRNQKSNKEYEQKSASRISGQCLHDSNRSKFTSVFEWSLRVVLQEVEPRL